MCASGAVKRLKTEPCQDLKKRKERYFLLSSLFYSADMFSTVLLILFLLGKKILLTFTHYRLRGRRFGLNIGLDKT